MDVALSIARPSHLCSASLAAIYTYTSVDSEHFLDVYHALDFSLSLFFFSPPPQPLKSIIFSIDVWLFSLLLPLFLWQA